MGRGSRRWEVVRWRGKEGARYRSEAEEGVEKRQVGR
jgi:hypothetical protein